MDWPDTPGPSDRLTPPYCRETAGRASALSRIDADCCKEMLMFPRVWRSTRFTRLIVTMLTSFDHNFLKSTNFSASRPSWNAEWRDLALGAKSNFQNANFHAEISRNFDFQGEEAGPLCSWPPSFLCLANEGHVVNRGEPNSFPCFLFPTPAFDTALGDDSFLYTSIHE